MSPILSARGGMSAGAYGWGSAGLARAASFVLLSSNYIGNNYSSNYGFASTGSRDGSGNVRWHRVNPQSSSSGFHDMWNGSTWSSKAIFNVSPGREIFGYSGDYLSSTNGYFVIVAGQASGSSTALTAMYYYEVASNTWSSQGNLPGARRYLGFLAGGGYTSTNDVFAFGGVGTSAGSSTQVFNTNYRLNVAGTNFTTRATHPLNYEWLPYSPATRGVTGNVSTYRVHTVGGYSAPGGTYATEVSTLAHYGYQDSSDTWTTYTSFPGSGVSGTSTAPNIAGTADRIYVWDYANDSLCYTWDGSNWTAQSIAYKPPTTFSLATAQIGSFIDSSQKINVNANFYGIYRVDKVS